MTPPTFLIHHDNPVHTDGVRLAVASVRRHCSDSPLLVSVPGANGELRAWLVDQDCRLLEGSTAGLTWNAKPMLLLRALAAGYDAVVWVDHDVLLTADPRARLPADPTVFVAAQEPASYPLQGTAPRRAAWGLPAGRDLPITVNSSVIRATIHHVALLEQWQALLGREDYVAAQSRPWDERPFHLLGDQDALGALVGSDAQRDTKVMLLRRGIDIAHCSGPEGLPVIDRLRTLRGGMPPFVHSMGQKPWEHGAAWRHEGDRARRLRADYEDLHLRLSPYSVLARELAPAAGISAQAFAPTRRWERVALRLGDRSAALPELPVVAFDGCLRAVSAAQRRLATVLPRVRERSRHRNGEARASGSADRS